VPWPAEPGLILAMTDFVVKDLTQNHQYCQSEESTAAHFVCDLSKPNEFEELIKDVRDKVGISTSSLTPPVSVILETFSSKLEVFSSILRQIEIIQRYMRSSNHSDVALQSAEPGLIIWA